MPGGAFNLRVVSDSVPDWSSRENFVRSALSGWKTNHQKALAQFRWSYLCRRVGPTWYDHGRPVHDPVLFFNSYGMTMCGDISSMNLSLWETAGWKARNINVNEHVVAEAFYDGAWHMFDNDFYNYFLNEKGEVASGKELFEARKRVKGKHYPFDHCPTASCRGGRIYMGPSSWEIEGVARDWWNRYRPMPDFRSAKAGQRYILGVRPNENYTRHWKPLGLGARYCRLRGGRDPMAKGGSTLMNCRANGIWEWVPDVSDANVLFAAENVRCAKSGLSPRAAGKPASAVFRVMAANVVTSGRMLARVTGKLSFSVSGNGGVSWSSLSPETDAQGQLAASLGATVGGRLEYLLKVELESGARLESLKLETLTQVNPRALPALRLGANRIAAVSDEHLEYLTFFPRLTNNAHSREALRVANWQSLRRPHTAEPSIRGTGPSELVFKAVAPRDIRVLRMACTAQLVESSATFFCEASFDGGRTWKQVGVQKYDGKIHDKRLSYSTRDIPAGTREVLLRYRYSAGGCGLVDVFAEVGYRPAGPRMAYDVAYCWEEYRDGKWIERQHLQRVREAARGYAINVGGTRPPRMKWVRVSAAGKGKTGYSDGEDVGGGSARKSWRLELGEKLSAGCRYELSRKASKAFPDRGGKVLTDGYVGLASYWGLGNINLAGKKNKGRVGQLVVWEPGEELVATLDLGRAREVGGARICAVQPNAQVLYPATMTVELSLEGKSFRKAGEVGWEEVFFPTGEFVHWEGFDSPRYDSLPAGGRLDFRFPVVFAPRKARYVRFRLAPPEGGKAGIGLWELEVFDRISRKAWSERLVLPETPAGRTK